MTKGKQILDLIEAIAADPSKNNKQALLKAVSPDLEDLLKCILSYTYDGEFTFGIKYVEPKTGDSGVRDIDHIETWVLLHKLSTGEISGNYARERVNQMVAFFDDSSAELFRRIIHKDIRAGFSASTINKVWPGLIPDVPYMRCSTPKDSKIEQWDWDDGIYVQLKADGMFQRCIVNGESVTFVSRSGEYMPPEAFVDLKNTIARAVYDGARREQMEMDGELIVYDKDGNLLDRATGNGMINSVRQGGEWDDNFKIVYSVWDYRSVDIYDKRMLELSIVVRGSENDTFVLNPSEIVYSIGAAFKKCQQYMTARLEGAIIKKRTGKWKDGTSRDQVKLKVAFQVEVEFTHFIEGAKGKKTAKTFGAIAYKSKCGNLTGSCSGFSDKERADINANREDWIGAIGTVEANDITKGRDSDVYALSHPRFIERRFDKTEADTLEQMLATLDATRLKFEQGVAA